MKSVQFINKDHSNFYSTLGKHVEDYFRNKKISRYANSEMIFKTFFMLALYFVPYALILSGRFSLGHMFLLTILMGFGTAGIGFCIVHDANHNAYSSKKWVNTLMSYAYNMIGNNMFL